MFFKNGCLQGNILNGLRGMKTHILNSSSVEEEDMKNLEKETRTSQQIPVETIRGRGGFRQRRRHWSDHLGT